MTPRLLLAMVMLLAAAPSASAGAIFLEGVHILHDPTVRYTTGAPAGVEADLAYNQTGVPTFNGILLDTRVNDAGSVVWTLESASTSRVQLTGTPSQSSRLLVGGLNGIYTVSGVLGTPSFSVDLTGPPTSINVPAGLQTIIITNPTEIGGETASPPPPLALGPTGDATTTPPLPGLAQAGARLPGIEHGRTLLLAGAVVAIVGARHKKRRTRRELLFLATLVIVYSLVLIQQGNRL